MHSASVLSVFLIPVFVTLYEEETWPEDPIPYAREFFGAVSKEEIDAELETQANLKKQIAQLSANTQ